jgi:hypothetical protein
LKQAIQDWAYYKKKLTELGKRKGGIDLISSEIRKECKLEFEFNDDQLRYVDECLDKEYKRGYQLGESFRNSNVSKPTLENLSRMFGQDCAELSSDVMDQMARSNPGNLRQIVERAESVAETAKKVADMHSITLVRHIEREKKISTEKPIPTANHNMRELCDSISKLVETFREVTDKVESYQPFDNSNLDVYTINLKKRIDIIDSTLRSIIDNRNAYSPVSQYFIKECDISASSLRNPVIIQGKLTGEYRKMVSKSLKKGKHRNELEEYQKAVTGLEKSFRKFVSELSDWCDYKSTYSGAKAARRYDAHDKLSEKA